MTTAALLSHYNVPASRVVGVTPMLGRPLTKKTVAEAAAPVEYSSVLAPSSSLPAIGGPSGKLSRAALSLDELRFIALVAAPGQFSKKASLGKMMREASPKLEAALPTSAKGSAVARQVVLPAASVDREASAQGHSRKARRGSSNSPLARLAAMSRPLAQPEGPMASGEEAAEGDEEINSDEEEHYESRYTSDKVRKPWSPDSDAVVAGPSKGKKKEPVGNPFVGADESGRKLQWERKWLVENPEHLEMRRRQFQTDGRLTSLATRQMNPDLAYEMKVYHGAYSMQIKANVMHRLEKRRLRDLGMSGAAATDTSLARRPLSATATMATMNSQLSKVDKAQQQPEKRKGRGPQEQACVRMLRQLQKELKDSTKETKAGKDASEKRKTAAEGKYMGASASASRKESKNL